MFGLGVLIGQERALEQARSDAAEYAELLAAVASRKDRTAFSALYRDYAPKVRALAMRMGVERAGADEIAQETMLAVWRRATTYDPAQASVSTWIYAIARNRVIDAMRRKKRAVVDPNDPAFEQTENPDAERQIDAEREAVKLRSALEELPLEQAEVLRISYFEGKSQSLIADELNLPLGTVKSRTRLGLARLREALEGSP